MKEEYWQLVLEILLFDVSEIITTSGKDPNEGDLYPIP